MDAEETGYGTRAVGRGVDTDAVLFRIVESGGCMYKKHRWCVAHGCMKRARGCTTHGCITHGCREKARGCIGRAQGCVSYGCIWVSRGSLGAGVHLVYLEDVAHRHRKGAHGCVTHGCVFIWST